MLCPTSNTSTERHFRVFFTWLTKIPRCFIIAWYLFKSKALTRFQSPVSLVTLTINNRNSKGPNFQHLILLDPDRAPVETCKGLWKLLCGHIKIIYSLINSEAPNQDHRCTGNLSPLQQLLVLRCCLGSLSVWHRAEALWKNSFRLIYRFFYTWTI